MKPETAAYVATVAVSAMIFLAVSLIVNGTSTGFGSGMATGLLLGLIPYYMSRSIKG